MDGAAADVECAEATLCVGTPRHGDGRQRWHAYLMRAPTLPVTVRRQTDDAGDNWVLEHPDAQRVWHSKSKWLQCRDDPDGARERALAEARRWVLELDRLRRADLRVLLADDEANDDELPVYSRISARKCGGLEAEALRLLETDTDVGRAEGARRQKDHVPL